MKITHWFFLSALALPISALADRSSDALTACKTHIASVHEGEDIRRTIKKIRKKGSKVDVTMKVSVNGERYTAHCLYSHDSGLTYTSDWQPQLDQSVAAQKHESNVL